MVFLSAKSKTAVSPDAKVRARTYGLEGLPSAMSTHSWKQALATYITPAALALLLLGFASGLPFMLVFSTLALWLREAGVSAQTIGFASLIGLSYAFKWVWAPLLDQWRLPLIGKLGRRRSWLFLSQLLVVIGLSGMALCNPQHHLAWTIVFAVLVAFASATQDIAIDAYRLESAESTRQAALAATYQTGYRLAVLLGTAGALYFAGWFTGFAGSDPHSYNFFGWSATYLLFALLMLGTLAASLLLREPDLSKQAPQNRDFGLVAQLASVLILIVLLFSIPALVTQLFETNWIFLLEGGALLDFLQNDRAFLLALLYFALIALCLSAPARRGLIPVLRPINDFINRYRWQALLLLGLIATYRMSDIVLGTMANVFYIDQGFSKVEIANVSKVFGLIMTLLGAGAGGLLVVRFGILPILFVGGIASATTNLMFLWLLQAEKLPILLEIGFYTQQTDSKILLLILTISCDNLSGGLASAAFIAYLSSLTNLKFSASQYALLSSIMLLLPRLIGGYSGKMVESFGYAQFFVITALLGIPTLFLILWQWRWPVKIPASS